MRLISFLSKLSCFVEDKRLVWFSFYLTMMCGNALMKLASSFFFFMEFAILLVLIRLVWFCNLDRCIERDE